MKQLELIQWKDHWSRSTGWLEELEVADYRPEVCTSVGYVIHEDEEVVILSANVHETSWRGEMCVLKSCITERQSLEV